MKPEYIHVKKFNSEGEDSERVLIEGFEVSEEQIPFPRGLKCWLSDKMLKSPLSLFKPEQFSSI